MSYIKEFLAWLKSIYFKPAQAETQTPEVTTMSEPLVDAVADPQPVVVDVTADVKPLVGSSAEVAAEPEPETTETDAVTGKNRFPAASEPTRVRMPFIWAACSTVSHYSSLSLRTES